MTALPTFLRPNLDAPFADLPDSTLRVTRDYWRIAWDDAPGFATACDAAGKVLDCEAEMRRRGIQP